MGVGRTTEHNMRREFINKLEKNIGKDIIILEEIFVPKKYIIGSNKKKTQVDIVLLRKDLIFSKKGIIKWLSGAVIAIIEIKSPNVSAQSGVTQVISYNQYFNAEFIFSTNYCELISIPTIKGEFAFEVNEFSNQASLIEYISNLIKGVCEIEPYRLNLQALLALFSDINIEFSTLFKGKDIEDLEKVGFLYARNLDTDTIKTQEDRNTYQESLLFTNAHILLTQLLFYRILQQKVPRLGLNPLIKINKLSNIINRFNEVLRIDYESVFALNVIGLLKSDFNTLTLINLVLKIFTDFKIEDVKQDLLGFLLQRLIPFNYRKKIAAYYTKISAARLLAGLAITSANQSIFDPACGSGGLLVASYHRKIQLNGKISHQEILSKTFGSDISPFACLLTTINLAIQAPVEFTTKCNIALSDAFELDLSRTLIDMVGLAKGIQFTSLNDINPMIKRYKVPKVDILIANPPFTRADRMENTYKNYLTNKFSGWGFEVNNIIDKKHLGLYGYFLLGAKRHLKNNGTFAFILPYSALYTESMEPIISEIRKQFGIKYIIKSEVDPAFSDSVFEEIMMIGSKNYEGPMKIAILKKSLEKMDFVEIDSLINKIIGTQKSEITENLQLMLFNQSELDDQKWTVFFHRKEFIDFWIMLKKVTSPIYTKTKTIRGNRVAPIDLFGLPNKNWEVYEVTDSVIKVKNKNDPKISIQFPYNLLYRSMKRYNEMVEYSALLPEKIPNTFYIKEKSSNKVFKKWLQLNKFQTKEKLYPPIKRLTHLAIPQKIGLMSTKTLAFYTKEKLHVGDGFMSIMMNSEDSFWYFCYLNSSFGLLNILVILRVISGWYGQILGPDMRYLRIPDFKMAQDEIKAKIKENVIKINKTPVKDHLTFIEEIERAMKDHFDPLYQLDVTFAKLMGLEATIIKDLHKILYQELERFRASVNKLTEKTGILPISKNTISTLDKIISD